ncbi:MAG: tRNA (N(6)-L-threonylcarbamoyladenosine(37)-C(2))-methylthiotransferase MtaB [Candidatus Izemoplasmatales bacterium]|nr:tRNA (N(6)-L-threonylcarbamoyladenosine(37)-C(2))-methylthiotransferase MtaB [Candidatus Izemoplasmatales bacterium]NLF49281.1 tRNA (N(6)-L-threonylcarbamoyladenosine(37)-C(2))-methylthiotransferase MtaB [Acholeplasmataceae bacterium]
MKVALTTLGCKVNTYETEAIWEQLKMKGFTRVDFNELADLYVINTCMVTNTGEAKSRQMIRHPLKLNPNAILVVMGCLAELNPDSIAVIEQVKVMVGTKDRERIPDLLDEYLKTGVKQLLVTPLEKNEPYDLLKVTDFSHQHRAFLKIEDGCDNFCSYCIIPYARGRVRSKPKARVLEEAKELGMQHAEIILTGIHTGGYGADLPNYKFADLLEDLGRIQEINRIRISSIEINELTERVIDIIASSEQICHHLHVPLQSGSDWVLRQMNRKYNTIEYREKIRQLREQIPNLAITTDVIVGFPGETDQAFEETCHFVEEIGFSELHVFPFSPRKGTIAASLPAEVPGDIKKRRVARLIAIGKRLAKRSIQKQIGSILRVIPERQRLGRLQGHSRNYIQVAFLGNAEWIGKEVRVRLISENYPLSFGEMLPE